MYLCDWKEKVLWERCERCVKIEAIFHVKNSSNREATLIYCRLRWEFKKYRTGNFLLFLSFENIHEFDFDCKHNETFGWIRLLLIQKIFYPAHFNRIIFFFQFFFINYIKSLCAIFNFSCYNYDSIKTLNAMKM